MIWTIATLDYGVVELNPRRMLFNASGHEPVSVPVQGWLLSNGQQHVVIDTGFRDPDVFGPLGDGVRGHATAQNRIEHQLQMHGLRPCDVSHVLHTHLHIDHAGQTDRFPDSTVAVVNRKELEYAVSGLSGPSYPAPDIKHLIDRLHTKGALRLLDLEYTEQEYVLPGIRCVPAYGHTEGSMIVYVDTQEGLACFCGDLIYSVFHQLSHIEPFNPEPRTSANSVVARRAERASLKRMLSAAPRMRLYPSHDDPVWIENGVIADGVAVLEQRQQTGCWCSLLENPLSGVFTKEVAK